MSTIGFLIKAVGLRPSTDPAEQRQGDVALAGLGVLWGAPLSATTEEALRADGQAARDRSPRLRAALAAARDNAAV